MNKEIKDKIKLNELRIEELIKQRNETMNQIMRLYEKESQNEQTD